MKVKSVPVSNPLNPGMVLYVVLGDEPIGETTLAYTLQAHQEC